MKYRHLFFDLDHTLWDFDANARVTLASLYEGMQLKERGVHDFELFYKNYLVHNDKLWERYRKGYIRQDELRVKRMWLSLLDFKIADDELSKAMSIQFIELLPTRTILFPYAKEILQYLKDKGYELHLITNGFEKVQHSKLRNSGLDVFFGKVITSEGSNSLKPNKEIFDYAFLKTGATATNSIMLGDTLEVDIQGAINVGMDQVFVNHLGITAEIKPTYMVRSLQELESIF
jgi:putative hydrolase of the HAD superfamily